MNRTRASGTQTRLRLLGGIDARRGEEPLSELLAQPKRLGLLAYIALRRPDGAVSRDDLLGAFWPESTEQRARASLRQALHFLRGHLGGDALVNRGDAEVRLDPDIVSCDAVDLRRAIEAGDDAATVDGYGGELLPGLVVTGAWEFDRWLHAERQKLRNAAVQAALRTADAAEAAGDLGAAADRVRWALGRDPTNEAVARRLISLLARDGNRAGAVAAYDALEARLAEDLELEPSPETVELIDAVRADGGLTTADGPGAGAMSRRRVLVLGLENVDGDAELAVGRLAAETLAQGLATIPDLEVVPPMALGPGGGPDAPPDALARSTGAGTLVGGTYHADGDRLHLSARITDVVHDRLMEAPAPVVGSVREPVDALEELRDGVMTVLAPALTERVVHVKEAVRPPSITAYTEYVDGLDQFIRGEWDAALARFRRSVELEPEYALPRIVCAITLWNLCDLEAARATALEAKELEGALGRFERGVLDSVLSWLDGDWAAAQRAARVQADMAPGSIPHFQVAEEARRLNRPREAREVLSLLEPEQRELHGWIFYWIELTTAHHLMGDHTRELEAASRCGQHYPGNPIAMLMEIRALAALGRPDDVTRLCDQALAMPATREPTPGTLLREAGLELQAHGGNDGALLERAVDWYEERAGDGAADGVQRDLARTLYYAGRLDGARRIFTELVEPDAGVRPMGYHHGQLQAHLDQGYLAVIAARQDDGPALDRWRPCLEELDRPFLYGAPWFWLAAVDAVQGEKDRAVKRLRRAFADGMPHELFIHTDPHLLRLRGHGPFDALMQPRG